MAEKQVAVISTGIANTASVVAGLERSGAKAYTTDNPDDVTNAEFVVLPGVGAFAAGRSMLDEKGITEVLVQRIANRQATLAICLGFQLLCQSSEESPGVAGLGILPVTVEHFPNSVAVPQLGWNKVSSPQGSLLSNGYAYFANSYRVRRNTVDEIKGWSISTTDYAGEFVSAVESSAVVACQFHPELSGEFGQGVLQRWLGVLDADN